MSSSFVPFAFLSGTFGAMASCLAKFAFSSDTFVTSWTRDQCLSQGFLLDESCLLLVYALRALFFVGTLTLNIFMVGSFLEGMEESGSVAGTAMSSAANFVVSSLLGFWLWNERLSQTWLLGFACVILGTILLASVKAGHQEKPKGD
jgi:drug/metabolite transporter (DMT)-like permease